MPRLEKRGEGVAAAAIPGLEKRGRVLLLLCLDLRRGGEERERICLTAAAKVPGLEMGEGEDMLQMESLEREQDCKCSS